MSKADKTGDIERNALERIFHSPSRMAILSALCAADKAGLSFTELKQTCDLTDGNLNSHLAALLEEGVVRVRKEFVGLRPRSTVFLTAAGLDRFSQYLDALQQALQAAQAALPAPARKSALPVQARAARVH